MSQPKHDINTPECRFVDKDPKEISRLFNGLMSYVKKLNDLGFEVFGGSGCLSIRYFDSFDDPPVVCASARCQCSGGDGAEHYDEEGLLRGEGEDE